MELNYAKCRIHIGQDHVESNVDISFQQSKVLNQTTPYGRVLTNNFSVCLLLNKNREEYVHRQRFTASEQTISILVSPPQRGRSQLVTY